MSDTYRSEHGGLMKVERPTHELPSLLSEQIGFLRVSAAAFDAGAEAEGKRLATVIRTLVHETKNSRSLLGQLGRTGDRFLDTSTPRHTHHPAPIAGLVMAEVNLDPNFAHRYVPLLEDAEHTRQVTFNDWWNGVAILTPGGLAFSRRDLVLNVANMDGGAHVDTHLEREYLDLTRNNAMKSFQGSGDQQRPMPSGHLAAIRQMAHELLKMLVPDYVASPRRSAHRTLHISSLRVVPEGAQQGQDVWPVKPR